MLERQGIHVNQKKLRRLYREEGLQVRIPSHPLHPRHIISRRLMGLPINEVKSVGVSPDGILDPRPAITFREIPDVST